MRNGTMVKVVRVKEGWKVLLFRGKRLVDSDLTHKEEIAKVLTGEALSFRYW